MASDTADLINVAVIFGGQSNEHEVSCLTAAGVLGAIDQTRYRVHGIGIDKSGLWHRYSVDEIRALQIVDGVMPSIGADHPLAELFRDAGGVHLATLDEDRLTAREPIDVAFPLMHGAYAEDGTVQGKLEMLGLKYVGCGVTSSALGMDKEYTHTVLEAAGVPTAAWVRLGRDEWMRDPDAIVARIGSQLGYPVFVKPARGGSSVGIGRVTGPDSLAAAIDAARLVDPKVLVEQAVVGAREVECGILGGDGTAPRASHTGEIVMHTEDRFYDYRAKYLPEEQVDLRVPAGLEPQVERRVQELALQCFTALDCEGLARVDTFVLPDGQVLINEINTMPGFTKFSMYPNMWRASGIDYPELIDQLIALALSRPATVLR